MEQVRHSATARIESLSVIAPIRISCGQGQMAWNVGNYRSVAGDSSQIVPRSAGAMPLGIKAPAMKRLLDDRQDNGTMTNSSRQPKRLGEEMRNG